LACDAYEHPLRIVRVTVNITKIRIIGYFDSDDSYHSSSNAEQLLNGREYKIASVFWIMLRPLC